MTEDKDLAEPNKRLEAEMIKRRLQFEEYKEQRKWQGILGREELIALCATHLLAGSFRNKLDPTGSDNAWNAVKMAAEIVDYSFTRDDLELDEGMKQAKKRIEEQQKKNLTKSIVTTIRSVWVPCTLLAIFGWFLGNAADGRLEAWSAVKDTAIGFFVVMVVHWGLSKV